MREAFAGALQLYGDRPDKDWSMTDCSCVASASIPRLPTTSTSNRPASSLCLWSDFQERAFAKPTIGPAFHDPQLQPGHTYQYAVTAIDQSGHESPRSPEAEETIPNP